MLAFGIFSLFSTSALALNARFSQYGDSSGLPSTTTRQSIAPPYPTASASSNPSPTGGSCAPYWMEEIKHQGIASFNENSTTYQVFRNVKDFGAVGDGRADDTAAIQRAMSEGGRCGPGGCQSSTKTPALVYFPQGTYLISASLIDYYYTQVCSLFQIPMCLNSFVMADYWQPELPAYFVGIFKF